MRFCAFCFLACHIVILLSCHLVILSSYPLVIICCLLSPCNHLWYLVTCVTLTPYFFEWCGFSSLEYTKPFLHHSYGFPLFLKACSQEGTGRSVKCFTSGSPLVYIFDLLYSPWPWGCYTWLYDYTRLYDYTWLYDHTSLCGYTWPYIANILSRTVVQKQITWHNQNNLNAAVAMHLSPSGAFEEA